MSRSNRIKRRVALLVGIALVAVAGWFIFQAVRGASSEKMLAEARVEGLEAHQRGEYDKALQRLSYYLSTHNDDVEALIAFADARQRRPLVNNRHLMESIRFYQEAVSHEPENLEALRGLVALYERVQRRVEWMELAQRILAIDPDDTEAMRLLAIGHVFEGRYEEAATYTEKLVAVEPDNIDWRALHLQVMRQQGTSEAGLIEIADQWTEQWEGDGRLHMIAAQTRLAAGRVDAGRTWAIEAAQRGADSVTILQQLASMLDMLQLSSDATELIRSTQERFPDEAWPHVAAVRRLWQSNRLTDALEIIERYEQTSTEDGAARDLDREMLRWKALLLVQTGRNDQASTLLDTLERDAAERTDEERNADRAFAEALRIRMTFDTPAEPPMREVIETYASSMALAPADPVLAFLSGEAHQRIGEYGLATSMFATALRSDPNWVAARLALAEALLAAGQPNEALAQATALLTRTQSPPLHAYTVLVRSWLGAARPGERVTISDVATGRRMSVLELLERLTIAHPDHAGLRSLYVRAALKEGDTSLASELIEAALAWADAQSGHDDADSDANDEASAEATQRANLLVELAQISRTNQMGYEEQLLDAAEGIAGTTVGIVRERAAMWRDRGQPDDGLAAIDAFLASSPSTAESDIVQRIRAAYMAQVGHEDALDAMWDLLGGHEAAESTTCDEDSLHAAVVVLEQSVAWTDERLIERAIQCMEHVVGDDSPRVVLARSRSVRTFRADDGSAVASAQLAVNGLLQRMPGAVAAMEEMAALALVDADGRDSSRRAEGASSSDAALAIRYLERAVNASPTRVDLRLRLADMLQRQGDWSAAEQQLRIVREIRQPVTAQPPGGSPTVANIDDLLLTEMQLLLRQGDDASVISRLSNALGTDGVSDAAMSASEMNAADRSRLLTARRILASALNRAGRSTEAEDLYQRLLADYNTVGIAEPTDTPSDSAGVQPSHWRETLEAFAMLLVDTGRTGDALDMVRDASLPGGDAGWRDIVTGRVLWQAGQLDDAAAAFERAIETGRSRGNDGGIDIAVRGSSELASLRLSQGEVEKACDVALAGLEIAPGRTDIDRSSLQSTLVLTLPALEADRRNVALSRLAPRDDAPRVAIEPAVRDIAALLRSVITSDGRLEPTSTQLTEARRILERHPQSIAAFRIALYLHLESGQVDGAITLAQQAAARMPSAVEPIQRAAHLLRQQGRLDDAMAAAQTWRSRAARQPLEADLFMASLALQMNDAQRAYSVLSAYGGQLVPDADSAESPARQQSAQAWLTALVRSGRLDEAASAFGALLQSDDIRWLSTWLDAARRAGSREAAREAIERAEQIVTLSPRPMLALASAWQHVAGRFDDSSAAERANELAVTAASEDGELQLASLLLRAQVAESQQDPGTAESLYREALSINENNVIALNNLAYLLVREGRQCDEAALLASRAIEHVPDVPEILDTRAQAALCVGDADLAEQIARQGLEIRDDDRDLLVTLVTALANQGRTDEARRTQLRLERVLRSAEPIELPASRGFEQKLQRMRDALDQADMRSATPRPSPAAA